MSLFSDGGGIYTLGFQPGTILRASVIHDIRRGPFAIGAPNNGIFFDQGSKGYLVERNVIYNLADSAPMRHNQNHPSAHTIKENILCPQGGPLSAEQETAAKSIIAAAPQFR